MVRFKKSAGGKYWWVIGPPHEVKRGWVTVHRCLFAIRYGMPARVFVKMTSCTYWTSSGDPRVRGFFGKKAEEVRNHFLRKGIQ